MNIFIQDLLIRSPKSYVVMSTLIERDNQIFVMIQ
jgi:hypothetical protein